MPKPKSWTAKGKAEAYIRQHAHDWLTVDVVHQATGLPKTAIRAAVLELCVNRTLYRVGPQKKQRFMYQDWKLEQLRENESA